MLLLLTEEIHLYVLGFCVTLKIVLLFTTLLYLAFQIDVFIKLRMKKSCCFSRIWFKKIIKTLRVDMDLSLF